MEGISLKSRAVAFAFCVGAVSFILALLAGVAFGFESQDLIRAIVIAIVCAVMSWASAERAISGIAESIDAAIGRLSQAVDGDLISPCPPKVAANLPDLSNALDGLLMQVRANFDSVHTLAMYDPVTQLANRTNFRREAGRMLRELPEDLLAALFFIDLDRFKNVNDSMGHANGDKLLAKVANRLRAVIDPDEGAPRPRPALIGRLAGDEFTIFLPDVPTPGDAERIARAVLYALSEPFDLAGQQVEIGASIGVALRPVHGRSLTELMRAADVAMYDAKENGRGQVKLFTAALADRLADNARLDGDLRGALQRDEFELLLQPQIALATGQVVGAEALLRWNHPLLGVRLPAQFIGRAEECGLIHDIGEWGMEAVAKTLTAWREAGVDRRLAVNVSARQICRPALFARLRAVLDQHDAPLSMLEIEITETVAMECGDAVLADIAKLRDDGVTVAIDDFGTGYSNLSRLKDLPVDRVKIDRSLIADIGRDEHARTIAQAVIGLVHGLGYEAVAEGVETEEQLAVLAVIGCDSAQGHLIARPMSESAYRNWLHGTELVRAAG